MRKISVVPGLLVLFMILALCACGDDTGTRQQNAAATRQQDAAAQNAAVHYNKAFELMKFNAYENPAGGPVKMLMMQGWERHGTPELLQAIKDDAECFAEFAKGLELDRCDFTFGEQQFLYRTGDRSKNRKIWSMTCLNLSKARYAEFQDRGIDAVEGCYDQMKFMRHIAQGKPFTDKVTAMSLEERTLFALRQMLERKTLDRAACARLVEVIEELEGNRFSDSEIMDGEKEYYLFIVETVADRLVEAEAAAPEPVAEKRAGPFGEKMVAEARRFANHYYELVAKARASKSETDWQAVDDEAAKMREGSRELRARLQSTDHMIAYASEQMTSEGVDGATQVAYVFLGFYTSGAKGMYMTYDKILRLMGDVKKGCEEML